MEIARNKLADMFNFEHVTAEFAPVFTGLKGLAAELRNFLFAAEIWILSQEPMKIAILWTEERRMHLTRQSAPWRRS
jgi:hypothetical protein